MFPFKSAVLLNVGQTSGFVDLSLQKPFMNTEGVTFKVFLTYLVRILMPLALKYDTPGIHNFPFLVSFIIGTFTTFLSKYVPDDWCI